MNTSETLKEIDRRVARLYAYQCCLNQFKDGRSGITDPEQRFKSEEVIKLKIKVLTASINKLSKYVNAWEI